MTDKVSTKIPAWMHRAREFFPESQRERYYRFVSATVLLLFALGVLKQQETALWTQLGLSVVTALFAALYANSGWLLTVYLTTGPLGGVLMFYGIVDQNRWALVVAAVGQVFGITTAAAKTVQPPPASG